MASKTFAILVAGAILAATAHAGRPNCVLQALHALTEPTTDTAVELELGTTSKVVSLLTTSNGKVGGLFKSGEPVPPWYLEWAAKNHPEVPDPLSLDWEALDDYSKVHLLTVVTKSRSAALTPNDYFFANRKIEGLVMKKQVVVNFRKPTLFLGKPYAKGEQTLDVSSVFNGPVEYRSPKDLLNVSGVELHFRGGLSSGQISNDAWKLLDALGIQRPYQHVHVVAPLPLKELRINPKLEAVRMGDFFRRANLAAEMIDIVEESGKVFTHEMDGGVYFDSLSRERLQGVTQYFSDVAIGERPKIGDTFKMGWIGMRGADKYDQPGLWGIEVRSIGSKSNPETYRHFLDALQYSMHRREYGISERTMGVWLKSVESIQGRVTRAVKGLVSRSESAAAASVKRLWYNPGKGVLFEGALAPAVETELQQNAKALEKLNALQNEHYEIKMLLYHWGKDPLLFGNPQLAVQIAQAQATAIRRLSENEKVNVVMSDFLVDSGLYREVLKSVGVELRTARSIESIR